MSELHLNRVRRAVEDGLVRLAEEPLPGRASNRPVVLDEVPAVLVMRGHDMSESSDGIVYQHCGGGRRVIRKRITG